MFVEFLQNFARTTFFLLPWVPWPAHTCSTLDLIPPLTHLIQRTRRWAQHLETKERAEKVAAWTRIWTSNLSIPESCTLSACPHHLCYTILMLMLIICYIWLCCIIIMWVFPTCVLQRDVLNLFLIMAALQSSKVEHHRLARSAVPPFEGMNEWMNQSINQSINRSINQWKCMYGA